MGLSGKICSLLLHASSRACFRRTPPAWYFVFFVCPLRHIRPSPCFKCVPHSTKYNLATKRTLFLGKLDLMLCFPVVTCFTFPSSFLTIQRSQHGRRTEATRRTPCEDVEQTTFPLEASGAFCAYTNTSCFDRRAAN